jgi:hypothetical protein
MINLSKNSNTKHFYKCSIRLIFKIIYIVIWKYIYELIVIIIFTIEIMNELILTPSVSKYKSFWELYRISVDWWFSFYRCPPTFDSRSFYFGILMGRTLLIRVRKLVFSGISTGWVGVFSCDHWWILINVL